MTGTETTVKCKKELGIYSLYKLNSQYFQLRLNITQVGHSNIIFLVKDKNIMLGPMSFILLSKLNNILVKIFKTLTQNYYFYNEKKNGLIMTTSEGDREY